jgi:hypothetical protein
MSSLPMKRETRGTATVSVGEAGHDVVKIEGVLRDPDIQAWLTPIIEATHEAAVELALPEVVLDIQKLEYANAAAWRCFVQWLHFIHRDPQAKYRLRILSQPAYQWQMVGMTTLRIFGKESLIVEESAAPPNSRPPSSSAST